MGGISSLTIRERIAPGASLVWLNRPEKCNALSTGMLQALTSRLAELEADPSQRVVIFRGKGDVFCGGLDLREASHEGDPQAMAALVAGLIVRLSTSRLVFVAAVHGAACAGGAAIAVSCDHTVASAGFRIGFPEVRRGLTPSLLLPVLRRKLRDAHLRELLLTGLPMTADRAREVGLIHQVVGEEVLTDAAIAYAQRVLEAAPSAVSKAKAMLAALNDPPIEEEMRTALAGHIEAWRSAEAQEGVAAFVEKREPLWMDDPDASR